MTKWQGIELGILENLERYLLTTEKFTRWFAIHGVRCCLGDKIKSANPKIKIAPERIMFN